jgi:hypothetical protein
MQHRSLIAVALGLASACGGNTRNGSPSATSPNALACEDAAEPRELSLLTEESTDLALAPCGELSYTLNGRVYLVDSSLSQTQPLEGATALPTFDPRGRSMVFLREEERTFVYQDLRGTNQWSAPVPPPASRGPLGFYSKPGQSGLFHCDGSSVVDYDDHGNATNHELGLQCQVALYSAFDALLLTYAQGEYVSVTLGSFRTRSLGEVGRCSGDSCETTLVRRVLRKQAFVNQLMGDYFAPLPAGPPRYYDALSGTEVGATALVAPEGDVVAVSGYPIYLAADLTAAVTDDSRDGENKTILRYFGANPQQPERWLASSLTLEPRRGFLHALPARDSKRIAVWSETCDPALSPILLTFEPGHPAKALHIGGCALRVHWVGSDGTLLAQVWPDGTPWLGVTGAPLALIRADGRLELLDIDVQASQGVRQVVSNGRSLAIATGHAGPLYIVDLETAETRQLAPSAGRLLTDESRKRLAFQVPSLGSDRPSALWAGAFPH